METTKRTVLYVSDNKFMHVVIKDTLKPHNISVVSVYSGVEALQILKDLKPDLILSDIDMPGMSGIDLCKSLKDMEDYKKIPVVIYSGSENDEDIERAFLVGAKGYIIKKYHREVLAEKIIHYIR
ncbi:response regulator [Acidaminobacter sp. JC074]|uniref:response regulator n=1 Tax=Acidaminobacter sp. JC074 TaxID=2530199 RepID=UPI001F100A96|nr:response regulator [Acidaminobacter sp. JC074]MCH4890406.1 response regulator [Acidaminobacter sp. JC074]